MLDGLLYNESDLALEEHYTDTHGYTEINFAAFALLGKRFCPRIRGVQHQRIYRIDTEREYGILTSLVSRSDRTINLPLIREQWDRMGHFYASLESGHTTASVALKRLAGFSKKNRFYRANRELGRVFKTEFILQYMSQSPLRRRVRRGLLKGEQLHTLARDLCYGKRGQITARATLSLAIVVAVGNFPSGHGQGCCNRWPRRLGWKITSVPCLVQQVPRCYFGDRGPPPRTVGWLLTNLHFKSQTRTGGRSL